MTTGLLTEHQLVWPRARVHTPFARDVLLLVPTVRGEELIHIKYEDVFLRPSSEEAARSALMMLEVLRRSNSELEGIASRVVAEIQEWGAHAMRSVKPHG